MNSANTSPIQLLVKLGIYFVILLAVIISITIKFPEAVPYLPFGGSDVLERASQLDFEVTQSRLSVAAGTDSGAASVQDAESVKRIIMFLSSTLFFTLLVMLPVTWTYAAIEYEMGPSKTFVRALLVLPICASTVVLLIQDSLALAFGLAALVAAVRFRVALNDAIDGIFIFAAICIGLAAGIGYLGVATIMAMFFCMTNALLWHLDYGRNPIDDKRKEKQRAKLEKTAGT